MLLEGYLAKLNSYPSDEIKIVVTAVAKHVCAPSWDLINDWKAKRITWEEYTRRYKEEMMTNEKARAEMRRIKKLSETRDVRLICYEKQYPCHRYILLELIAGM